MTKELIKDFYTFKRVAYHCTLFSLKLSILKHTFFISNSFVDNERHLPLNNAKQFTIHIYILNVFFFTKQHVRTKMCEEERPIFYCFVRPLFSILGKPYLLN